jgi:hypothetical protein
MTTLEIIIRIHGVVMIALSVIVALLAHRLKKAEVALCALIKMTIDGVAVKVIRAEDIEEGGTE